MRCYVPLRRLWVLLKKRRFSTWTSSKSFFFITLYLEPLRCTREGLDCGGYSSPWYLNMVTYLWTISTSITQSIVPCKTMFAVLKWIEYHPRNVKMKHNQQTAQTCCEFLCNITWNYCREKTQTITVDLHGLPCCWSRATPLYGTFPISYNAISLGD